MIEEDDVDSRKLRALNQKVMCMQVAKHGRPASLPCGEKSDRETCDGGEDDLRSFHP